MTTRLAGVRLFRRRGKAVAVLPAEADLVAHFDAHDLELADGDPIEQWADLSGNGNHAVQADAASRPEFLASGPAVHFPAADLDNPRSLEIPGDFVTGEDIHWAGVYSREAGDGSGRTVLWYARTVSDSDGTPAAGLCEDGSTNRQRAIAGSGRGALARLAGQRTADDTFLRDGTVRVLQVGRAAAGAGTEFLRINGVDVSFEATAHLGNTLVGSGVAHIRLGGHGFDKRRLFGTLREVVIYGRVLDPAEMDAVDAYLAARWGLVL